MSRTSVAEVCLLILADNRGIATYLLVCIAPLPDSASGEAPVSRTEFGCSQLHETGKDG